MSSQSPNDPPRLRFAPSPSGYLHIGGARTALFNYLFARKHNGVLVLRIEDTDRQRSTPEAVAAILEGLRYLGLDWDEGPEKDGEFGPYFQSQRAEAHGALVAQLLESRHAYRCFCSKERLDELREAQKAAKQRRHYDRRCRTLDPSDAERRADGGEPCVVRFAVEPGSTRFQDHIRGDKVVDNDEIEDFIIRRTDGTCVYNLAVVGDDAGMKITHVIRGEDHLSNTPKQILLFQALELSVPEYSHIPLILGPGREKLSKRHGAVSVTAYEELGYVPEAMINFLARLGWSYDDKQEIFSKEELVEKFSLESVSKSGAMYDVKKLNDLGNYWLRQRSPESIYDDGLRFLAKEKLVAPDTEPDRPRLLKMFALEKDRIEYLSQLPDRLRFYFREIDELESKAAKILRKDDGVAARLGELPDALEAAFDSDDIPVEEALEQAARAFAEEKGVGLKHIAQPARAVLSGRATTPPLFEVLAILGKETCLRRLRHAGDLVELARRAVQ